ncbi:MAG: hypothetical protein MSC31_16490, partial [Solirubrobacteraceae bacterium MAG38_C4-C5]|nr:hypothetical protein [Candidatus Siliceabacter maunaloa]
PRPPWPARGATAPCATTSVRDVEVSHRDDGENMIDGHGLHLSRGAGERLYKEAVENETHDDR